MSSLLMSVLQSRDTKYLNSAHCEYFLRWVFLSAMLRRTSWSSSRFIFLVCRCQWRPFSDASMSKEMAFDWVENCAFITISELSALWCSYSHSWICVLKITGLKVSKHKLHFTSEVILNAFFVFLKILLLYSRSLIFKANLSTSCLPQLSYTFSRFGATFSLRFTEANSSFNSVICSLKTSIKCSFLPLSFSNIFLSF